MSTGSKSRQAVFEKEIAGLHAQLGIPEKYAAEHGLEYCEECANLVSVGPDIFDREQRMTPKSARAWLDMQSAAVSAGIELQLVSAYRSVDYQAAIFRRKLEKGQDIEDILKVSAAPGYSEHHSGRALDITTPGFEPLEEEFENSPAFSWLLASAHQFGFSMSYPRDNRHGLAYEPWHWCWSGGT